VSCLTLGVATKIQEELGSLQITVHWCSICAESNLSRACLGSDVLNTALCSFLCSQEVGD